MLIHEAIVRKHTYGQVSSVTQFIIQREVRTGGEGKAELIDWAISKATDFVNYENEWGEALFIDWSTDIEGQERIQIWDEQSVSVFPLIDVSISSRELD